jgi:uncharacterized protein (DUF983 family)
LNFITKKQSARNCCCDPVDPIASRLRAACPGCGKGPEFSRNTRKAYRRG